MASEVTRRQIARTLAAGTVLAKASVPPLAAQAPTPPLPANPEEELKAARGDARQRAEQLAKVVIPMSTEPAFVFKA